MRLKNKEYLLSPRMAVDVLDLAAAVKGEEVTETMNVISVAQLVNDSLKATGLSLNFFKRLKYRKFFKAAGTRFLLKNLSIKELFDAWEEVNELEGGKKKVMVTENQSAEMSAKD